MNTKNNLLFQFKVQIKDVDSPEVWRRLYVPARFSFDRFHYILQAAFGWQDAHLYEFSPDGLGSFPVITSPYSEPDTPFKNSVRYKLHQYFTAPGNLIIYTYDFGDRWEHLVTLENIVDRPVKSATCTDGGGACPPEDCGSVTGFEELKAAINDPTHSEYASMREWMGLEKDEYWNPGAVDLERVNRMLQGLR